MSAPHGFDDDQATRRLLRSRPPRAALEWAGAAMGGTVTSARALRGLLPPIHALPVPPPGVIRPFAAYRQDSYEPPGRTRQPAVRARAVEWFHRPGPDSAGPRVFIHRDFHPGNVLWRLGRVSGVVDWASASIGPACVDVGHCRGNLFGYGIQVAERFTAMWERLSGTRFDPWGDVVTIIGSLDGLRGDPPANPERSAVEDALARAVAELGRSPLS